MKPDTHTELAAIIPYFKGDAYIDECVISILSSTLLPGRIFIVDNDPEGIGQHYHWLAHPHVSIIRTKPAIGYGRAVNIGVYTAHQSGFQLFFVLNQDTRPHPECILSMVKCFESSKPLTIITPMIYAYDKPELSRHFVRYILQAQTTYFQDEMHSQIRDHYVLRSLGASVILFGLDIYLTLGLFDPVFYMYGEDNDLCMRVNQAGGMLVLDTSAIVQHQHSLVNSEGTVRRTIMQWFAISRIQLRIRFSTLSRVGFVVRSIYYFIKGILRRSDVLFDPMTYVNHIRPTLAHWKALKQYDAESIRHRIITHIHQDKI